MSLAEFDSLEVVAADKRCHTFLMLWLLRGRFHSVSYHVECPASSQTEDDYQALERWQQVAMTRLGIREKFPLR